MVEIVKGGRYRHYKGNEYRVIALAENTENKQQEVIYESLADGRIWSRPAEIFSGEVEKEDGSHEDRFSFIDQEEDDRSRYLRALADYQNLLRQSAKDKEDFFKFALAGIILDFLPVYDHLRLSIASLSEEEAKSPWVEGVKHVIKQFSEVLSQRGVEEIRTTGEIFDPMTMEAMDGEGDIVEKEVVAGYKLSGRVIRPAKVIVTKGK